MQIFGEFEYVIISGHSRQISKFHRSTRSPLVNYQTPQSSTCSESSQDTHPHYLLEKISWKYRFSYISLSIYHYENHENCTQKNNQKLQTANCKRAQQRKKTELQEKEKIGEEMEKKLIKI
jgi:hypothetical protein